MPTLRFLGDESWTVDVKEGVTVLEAAEICGARVGSSCGGQCACSTCHVYVAKGLDTLNEITEQEDERLDMAFDVKPESRLGCQTIVGHQDLDITISEESTKAWYDEHPEERNKR